MTARLKKIGSGNETDHHLTHPIVAGAVPDVAGLAAIVPGLCLPVRYGLVESAVHDPDEWCSPIAAARNDAMHEAANSGAA
ncbi:MAG: hypothetical protein ACTSYE_11405 [Alphaproteobacteria bacterium]